MTTTTRPGSPLDRLDRRLTQLMADHGLTALRIALGIVFFWFGVQIGRASCRDRVL